MSDATETLVANAAQAAAAFCNSRGEVELAFLGAGRISEGFMCDLQGRGMSLIGFVALKANGEIEAGQEAHDVASLRALQRAILLFGAQTEHGVNVAALERLYGLEDPRSQE